MKAIYTNLGFLNRFFLNEKLLGLENIELGIDCNIKVTPVGMPPLNKDSAKNHILT